MRLLLINGTLGEASPPLFERIAELLKLESLDVDVIHDLSEGWPDGSDYDLLVSHVAIPDGMNASVRCVGGRVLTRPAGLGLLEEAGVPTMSWSLAASESELACLFDRWDVNRLILKRSGTHGGKGTFVFDRPSIGQLRWNPLVDIFCAEVNVDSGDVYKAEVLNGTIVISWVSEAPSIDQQYEGGILEGLGGAYGRRSLYEFDSATVAVLGVFSRLAADRGLGYSSVDFMVRPDGLMVAIEVNPNDVATWWTSRFDFVAERYAVAIAALRQ